MPFGILSEGWSLRPPWEPPPPPLWLAGIAPIASPPPPSSDIVRVVVDRIFEYRANGRKQRSVHSSETERKLFGGVASCIALCVYELEPAKNKQETGREIEKEREGKISPLSQEDSEKKKVAIASPVMACKKLPT
jgi:hypothetical protein